MFDETSFLFTFIGISGNTLRHTQDHQCSSLPILSSGASRATIDTLVTTSAEVSIHPDIPAIILVDPSPGIKFLVPQGVSGVPEPVIHSVLAVMALTNVHPMQTHSKSGVFKPKVYAATLSEHGHLTIEEAFLSLEWTKAA